MTPSSHGTLSIIHPSSSLSVWQRQYPEPLPQRGATVWCPCCLCLGFERKRFSCFLDSAPPPRVFLLLLLNRTGGFPPTRRCTRWKRGLHPSRLDLQIRLPHFRTLRGSVCKRALFFSFHSLFFLSYFSLSLLLSLSLPPCLVVPLCPFVLLHEIFSPYKSLRCSTKSPQNPL